MKGNGKAQAAEPFVMMRRCLLNSDAWRSIRINERRIIYFLLTAHMTVAGKENGRLKAPHRQLMKRGAGKHYISAALARLQEVGLVDAHQNGLTGNVTYGLTFLPLHDGTPASDRWREFKNPDLKPLPSLKTAAKPSQHPKHEPFVKLSFSLIQSDAWRTLGINGHRFVEFLMVEHMNHGGRWNGKLKAPYSQLVEWGINSRDIANAIRQAEAVGIVDAYRAGRRSATNYTVPFLQ